MPERINHLARLSSDSARTGFCVNRGPDASTTPFWQRCQPAAKSTIQAGGRFWASFFPCWKTFGRPDLRKKNDSHQLRCYPERLEANPIVAFLV